MNKNIKINIPKWVKYIIETLYEYKYEAYIVGGCVRDSLLKRDINDWDITTNAKPEDVIRIFENLGNKIVPTGLKHGTVSIVIDKENYEVTTYRIDGNYSDGRHPDNVEFTCSLFKDLSRRDFTINAMAYNDKEGLIDYFGGLEDLDNKIIKCVGESEERFNEDGLRILRGIRFMSQLGFSLGNETSESMLICREKLINISQERIREELIKILMSNYSYKGLKELLNHDLLEYILPELISCVGFHQLNEHHDKTVFEHILSVVENAPPKLELRLSALLHDIGKPKHFTIDEKGVGHFYEHHKASADMSRQILTRLKFDNKTIDKVCLLVYEHMLDTNMKRPGIKRLINRVGKENIYDLLELAIADRKGMAREYNDYNDIILLRDKIDDILNKQEAFNIKDLSINGGDLIQLGIKQGKEIGLILYELLDAVLENPELNDRETLLNLASDKIKKR